MYYIYIFGYKYKTYTYILCFKVFDGLEKAIKKFFLGNGICTKDKEKAANDLLTRDHHSILRFLQEYSPGKLGAYFVPPMYFSSNPEVVNYQEYRKKTQSAGKLMDSVKGQIAEKIMFDKLREYFNSSKDDVIVLHSQKFFQSAGEKDFIVVNLTRGYVMAIEVKASASKGNCQKARKQLFEAKEKIEEIFGIISPTTEWLFLGIFLP